MKCLRGIALMLICSVVMMACGLAEIAVNNEGERSTMLNNQDIKKSLPMSYSAVRASDKGLGENGGYSDWYFELQAFYAEGIWEMLNAQCEIMKLDEQLALSDMNFLPVDTFKNVYQEHWNFGAKYLFLRNNVHVERLSEADLELLGGYMRDGFEPGSADVKQMVLRTLRDVICVDPNLPSDAIEYVYEPSGRAAPNNAVVLGLATMPAYGVDTLYVDAEAEALKYEAITAISEKAEQVMGEKLGVPVRIFIY